LLPILPKILQLTKGRHKNTSAASKKVQYHFFPLQKILMQITHNVTKLWGRLTSHCWSQSSTLRSDLADSRPPHSTAAGCLCFSTLNQPTLA